MIMRWLSCLLLLLAGSASLAQIRPMAGSGDPRLQTVEYSPDQVVQLAVATGYQLMVSFAAGERVETIAVGDSSAWQVTTNKRGDYIFVKSISGSRPTNMTVVTDARVYLFELVPGSAYGDEQAFSLRFTYPEEAAALAAAQPPPVPAYRYRTSGARALRPNRIVQQGERLIVEWPPNVALPAIFRIEEDGRETLVNSDVQNGRFVIAGLPRKLVFRLDRQIAYAVRRKAKLRAP